MFSPPSTVIHALFGGGERRYRTGEREGKRGSVAWTAGAVWPKVKTRPREENSWPVCLPFSQKQKKGLRVTRGVGWVGDPARGARHACGSPAHHFTHLVGRTPTPTHAASSASSTPVVHRDDDNPCRRARIHPLRGTVPRGGSPRSVLFESRDAVATRRFQPPIAIVVRRRAGKSAAGGSSTRSELSHDAIRPVCTCDTHEFEDWIRSAFRKTKIRMYL